MSDISQRILRMRRELDFHGNALNDPIKEALLHLEHGWPGPAKRNVKLLPLMSKFVLKARYSAKNTATLAVKTAKSFLLEIPDATAQLVVTSPPYNIRKSYEPAQRPMLAYLREQAAIFREAVRITRPGGSICWQVGHHVNGHGQIIPMDMLLYPVLRRFQRQGVYLRNRIIWHFEHGMHTSRRFSGRHEMLMWFTKGDSYKFDLDRVRVPQKYPGKRAYRGPRKGLFSGNPMGKNPGDVWVFPNVKGRHVEKTGHPCQFPIELVDRLIDALTDKGDLVVDPFVGVGTTVAAAVLRERRGAGCDTVKDYIDVARQRVHQAFKGTLAFRPRERPVYKPAPNTPLTTVPAEFGYVVASATKAIEAREKPRVGSAVHEDALSSVPSLSARA